MHGYTYVMWLKATLIKLFVVGSILFVNGGLPPSNNDTSGDLCSYERLQEPDVHYTCDRYGNVTCNTGWKTGEENVTDSWQPCSQPVCSDPCVHGICTQPGVCECSLGWDGPSCDSCLPFPGCMHGSCSTAFQCNCRQGWTGSLCSEPICYNCVHGDCILPNTCICHEGWTGLSCDICLPLRGCSHGNCKDNIPDTCQCEEGWKGSLCNELECQTNCVHGQCVQQTMNRITKNYCLCQPGWRGQSCDKCTPYWNCPNQSPTACTVPNECLCFGNEYDPNKLCNNTSLLGQNF